MKNLLIALAVVVPMAVGCGERDRYGANESGSPENAVSAGDIAKTPENFYGKTVTVTADVDEVYDSGAFALDEDAAFAGPDVLVLTPKGKVMVHDDAKVTVRGRVRPLVVTEMQRDYDWFDPAQAGDLIARFKERPVIIAESVRDEKGNELATAPPQGAPAS